jgi:hypothetical protein
MNNFNTKRIHTKAINGPGGLQCDCCRMTRSAKESRTIHNRIIRRRANIDLKKIVKNDCAE